MTILGSINALAVAAAWLLLCQPANASETPAADTPQELRKNCDAKDWESCYWLAYAYKTGDGITVDTAKATTRTPTPSSRSCEPLARSRRSPW